MAPREETREQIGAKKSPQLQEEEEETRRKRI